MNLQMLSLVNLSSAKYEDRDSRSIPDGGIVDQCFTVTKSGVGYMVRTRSSYALTGGTAVNFLGLFSLDHHGVGGAQGYEGEDGKD